MSREKRAHARVAIPLSARLFLGGKARDLPVRDVSLGGAFLYTSEPPGVVGTAVELELALTAGIKPLSLKAEIVRIVLKPRDQGGGVLGIGVQFKQVAPAAEQALLALMDRGMRGPGTHPRAYPRVHYLIDVVCRTKVELKALLRDVGEGGVGLTVDRAIPLNEEITIELSRPRLPPLPLDGYVVRCEPIPRVADQFHLGVRFKRVGELRKDLHAFLRRLYAGEI